MKRVLCLIRLVGLGLFALLGACNIEYEEREKVLGYRGKARIDPYLAATRLLERNGGKAESIGRVPRDLEGVNVLVVPMRAVNSKGVFERLLQWVGEGGHLIVCWAYGESFNELAELGYQVAPRMGPEEEKNARVLLESVGVRVTGMGSSSGLVKVLDKRGSEADGLEKVVGEVVEGIEEIGSAELASDSRGHGAGEFVVIENEWGEDEVFAVEFRSPVVLQALNDGAFAEKLPLESERELNAADAGGSGATKDRVMRSPAVIEVPYGYGKITVAGSAIPFRNSAIGELDHAAYLLSMQKDVSFGKTVFVYASGLSFWGLLWKRGSWLLLAVLLLVVMWLWMRGSRFGPILDRADQSHRATRGQLELTGGLFVKFKQRGVLVGVVRRRVLRQVQQRHPHLRSDAHEALAKMVQEQTEFSREEVENALFRPFSGGKSEFIKVMEVLHKVERL